MFIPDGRICWAVRAESAERRLTESLAIIDSAARETMLDQHPYHAIALLNEDEQRRLYSLLKGDGNDGRKGGSL